MAYEAFNVLTEQERNTVGKEIGRIRKQLGLSQLALCQRMSVYGVKV